MSTEVTTAAAPEETAATVHKPSVERRVEISLRANFGRSLSVVVPILLWFAPLDIEATTKHGLAIATFMIVAWITEALDHSVAGLIGCYLSMLGTSVPLLMNFAKSRGLDPLAIGMVWTFAAAGKIFAYQSSVLLLGYSYGYFRGKDLFRLGLWLTAVESLLLLLVVPLYWPLLGI